MAELRSAVWDCGSDKAPGLDDYTFAFLKKYWKIIGIEMFSGIKFFE